MKCKMCGADVPFKYWSRHDRKCTCCFESMNEIAVLVHRGVF